MLARIAARLQCHRPLQPLWAHLAPGLRCPPAPSAGVLYYVASKAYQEIPDTPPAPDLPAQQPLAALNSSSPSYNLSMPLVPSEPPPARLHAWPAGRLHCLHARARSPPASSWALIRCLAPARLCSRELRDGGRALPADSGL